MVRWCDADVPFRVPVVAGDVEESILHGHAKLLHITPGNPTLVDLRALSPPAMRTEVGEVQALTRPGVRPPIANGPVDQPQQLELGLRAHTRGDRAEKPERCFPRCNVSSTAISFSASDSRSFSARNSSSSKSCTDAGRPGFAEANAANAASFANARNLMITLTSTPYFRAASACEISCEVTSKKISHFSSGDSCRRLRCLPFSIITTSWFEAPEASQAWQGLRRDLYRKLGRKPPR